MAILAEPFSEEGFVMNATNTRFDAHGDQGWLERFGDYCYRASIPRVIQCFRTEATLEYESIINNLDSELAPEMEEGIAARLPADQGSLLHTERTLLPEMAVRLGADLSMADHASRRQMNARCHDCSQVGRCWLALRRKAGACDLQHFCPNSDELIALHSSR